MIVSLRTLVVLVAVRVSRIAPDQIRPYKMSGRL